MMERNTMSYTQNNRGVALLLAVLIASSALSVSLVVFSLLYGEVRLSGTVKDSLLSYYAADAGLECFVYWHYVGGATGGQSFATSTGGASNTIGCNAPINGSTQIGGTNACLTQSPLCGGNSKGQNALSSLTFAPETCTRLTVTTSYQNNRYVTSVDAFGESSSCGLADINTVQRTLFFSSSQSF